jgi:type III secretory pathway component EscU
MKPGKLISRSLRQNFHTAVVIVTNPASNAENVCLALDEPAEPDALHASTDDEAAGLYRLVSGSHGFRMKKLEVRMKN